MREREPTKAELERDKKQLEQLRKDLARQYALSAFSKATKTKRKPKQPNSSGQSN